jgi:hypothetical protein
MPTHLLLAVDSGLQEWVEAGQHGPNVVPAETKSLGCMEVSHQLTNKELPPKIPTKMAGKMH